MSEQLSRPAQPEKSVEEAFAAIDALYHGKYTEVLLPDAYTEFTEDVATLVVMEEAIGVGRFIIQFLIAETPEELSVEDDMKWVGLECEYTAEETAISIFTKCIFYSKDVNQDAMNLLEFEGYPIITIAWSAINWANLATDNTSN
jgi:hypothetical protein